MTDAPPSPCPRCGIRIPAARLSVCPGCLLRAAMEEPSVLDDVPAELFADPGEAGKRPRIGHHLLMERIGRGGTGVVYKAYDPRLKRLVALKMLAEGELASAADVERFRTGAVAAARLDHPNIVPIYAVGEHEGRHFFTMKLVEGATLAEQLHRYRGPREAAGLLAAVARAVHHGHERGIVHLDLKPSNLLIDAEGRPHVVDFGIAKTLDPRKPHTWTGSVVGTPCYMAPEQARPGSQPLTAAADVHGLGCVLYELLTGRPPFVGDTAGEVLARVLEAEPVPPRSIDPRVPRGLEAICLKCLEKHPGRRYGSAAELAEELRRYLAGEPLLARPLGRLARGWRWSRRHPLSAGILATLVWTLCVVTVGAVSIARAQEADLRRRAHGDSVVIARWWAGAALSARRDFARRVERTAERPDLVAALKARNVTALEAICKDGFTSSYDAPGIGLTPPGGGSPFVIWFVQDTTGRILARWPVPRNEIRGRDFSRRDYFRGVQQMVASGHFSAYPSRPFRATADGRLAFALAAPVYGPDGKWLGALVATVASDSALGTLRANDSGESSRTVVVVALADREDPDAPLPGRDEYVVVVHERLQKGMLAKVDPGTMRQLAGALPEKVSIEKQWQPPEFEGGVLEDYRDPEMVPPDGWLAAFAPVGQTPFAVIVQTRESAVLEVNTTLARRIVWWSLPFALGAAAVWLVFWRSRFRLRSGRT